MKKKIDKPKNDQNYYLVNIKNQTTGSKQTNLKIGNNNLDTSN